MPGDTNTGRFAYTGQIALAELGLYHYKARAYDPRLGRFLQTDPVGYEDQFNLYAYVGNDPFNRADPSGEETEGCRDNASCEESDKLPIEEKTTEPQQPPTTLEAIAVTAPLPVPVTIPAIPIVLTAEAGAAFLLLIYPPAITGAACELTFTCVMSSAFPPGVWPGDKGVAEWGRRKNGVGAREGKGRFHGIKQKDKGRATDSYGVNPTTGDVVNPEGEVVGNLDEVKSK